MNKKIVPLFLYTMLILLPAVALGKSDTTYTFRFVPEDDMFYVPWNGNDKELSRLLECVEQNKSAILNGSIPLSVDGYCDSKDTSTERLTMAKTRSNRVKTELILRGGLTEECFITKNHTSGGNYVTVRIIIPSGPSATELEAQRKAEEERLAAERAACAEQERLAAEKRQAEEARLAAEKAEAERLAAEQAERERQEAARMAAEAANASKAKPYSFALHANLLRWATLTPDLGIEWRISRSVGLAVNGSWTSWDWDNANRRYALWEVSPEIRWYLGENKRGYLGAMFKAGQFNYKLSETGKQGDLMGGGLTGGYVLPLGKALSLDFSLGLGCLNADYEKYETIDGVRVLQGSETKNWWGPINAGVTLVWKLF